MEKQPTHRKLKVALIVDSAIGSKYVYDLAMWAKNQDNIEISHLLIQHLSRAGVPASPLSRAFGTLWRDGVVGLVSKMLWSCIVRAEMFKLRRSMYVDHFAKRDLSEVVKNSIQIFPAMAKGGFVYRYMDADIARIKALEFDVLIRCGSGILRGDILTAARFGVLSFHHGDNRVNRGIPAGFWEVLQREPTTGFVIQQLTEELDGGKVIFRGAFPTQRYWLANQAALYMRSNRYMKHMLARIAATGQLPVAEESLPYFHPLYRTPGVAAQLRYVSNFLCYKMEYILSHHLLKRQQRWGVAFSRRDWKHLVMWKGIRIENPPGRFLADPFVVSHAGKDFCFVEDYDYVSKRGCISVYELGEKSACYIGVALTEPFHLSFPYVFEYGGTLYMVPETAKNKEIRLYECVSFPLQWKLKRVIFSGITAVDSMIFRHGDYWWLFSNVNPLGNGENGSELSAFYTTDPIDGEWLPHQQNPLIIDPAKARNGGILIDADAVYRVAQRRGFVQYGAGSAIYKIEELTPERFAERLVCDIEPRFYDRLTGTHHLHSNGAVTVFDFVEKMKLA